MKNNRLVSLLLIIGILFLINLLSRQFFLRMDITNGKQYTLSKATKDILRDLADPVTVSAYFSKDLPSEVLKNKRDFQELLIEYANRSKGNVDYEFISPNEDPTIEQELMQKGINPVMIQVREKDQAKSQKVFMGAVVAHGEAEEIIPLITPGAAMEYALTTSIKKLSTADKPYVGIIQGHGEPSIQELSQLYQSLSILYNVEAINLSTEEEIASRFKTVALIRPTDTIPPEDFFKMNNYLSKGGNLVVAFNKVEGDFSTAQGKSIYTGITPWLANKGISVDDAFVMDATCGTVTVQQRTGFFTMNNQVQFPYLPLINAFNDHPITDGLEQVVLQFASPINFLGDSSSTFIPLLQTSARSATARMPVMFDVSRQWSEVDFPMGSLNVGGLIEGNFGGNVPARLIVYSDGDFPISGQRGSNPDNINLMSNSIDFLSDDTGLINLRTKEVATRPIKELEDGKRATYKWVNFLLPIFLILGYGFIRAQRNRAVRMRRKEQRFA